MTLTLLNYFPQYYYKIPLGLRTEKTTKKGKGKGQSNEHADVVTDNKPNYSLQKLYNQRLPISTKKYMDLKKLCDDEVIPKQYVQDYIQLPYIDKVDYLDDIIQDETSNNGNAIQDSSEEIDGIKEKHQENMPETKQKEQTHDEKRKTAAVENSKNKIKKNKKSVIKMTIQKDEKKHEKAVKASRKTGKAVEKTVEKAKKRQEEEKLGKRVKKNTKK